MSSYLLDFSTLLLRWLHVVAAIAWIGESIYFVMLDNSLKPPQSQTSKAWGVFGEMWAVHGGGFYHNQKYLTHPAELPDDLHWSFWKAYTTWLSGFILFSAIYLLRPDFYLVNPTSAWQWASHLYGWQASALAIVFLAGGWLVYDQLCRRISPDMERDGLLSIAVAIMMVIIAWLSTQIFSGRAAFLITGAVMATAMSANVFFWIIPGQRRMVQALKAGSPVNPLDGKRGKQRSVHNTYFTLPVVLLMLSNHYSFIYSGPYSWLIMALFIFSGALIRQYFVLRHAGVHQPLYTLSGIVLIVCAAWLAAPTQEASLMPSKVATTTSDNIADRQPEIQKIIQQRCIQCHSSHPTMTGIVSAPAGIRLDTEEQIQRHAALIKKTVADNYMPLGNISEMTTEERDTIAAWQESD